MSFAGVDASPRSSPTPRTQDVNNQYVDATRRLADATALRTALGWWIAAALRRRRREQALDVA